MNIVSQLFYLGKWFFQARILGQEKPLQSVVFVTGGCNSTCRHCTDCTMQADHCKTFEDIKRDFSMSYRKGGRILDIEGVNLLRWKDETHEVKEIFQLARDMGFYSTSTMIPARDYEAWQKLGVQVDVLWVSILSENDLQYLETIQNASLYMVVNNRNYKQIPAILAFLKAHSQIKQMAFNFHTPFSGTETMTLSSAQRQETIEELICYKKKGYRIMNTVSGLKNMLHLRFKRYCWICNFAYCDGRQSPVCIDNVQSGLCDQCGFCMSGEMNAVFNCKPDTIWAGLKSRLLE